MKRVLVPLAPGFEEIEAVTVVDYLRRAGAHVVMAAVGGLNPVPGKLHVRVTADTDLESAISAVHGDFSLVVLPGGPAVEHLLQSTPLISLLSRRLQERELTAAICAAPLVLAKAGLEHGTRLTSFPGVRAKLEDYRYEERAVVRDRHVITSRGPGTAVPFALALVEALFGVNDARKLAQDTVS